MPVAEDKLKTNDDGVVFFTQKELAERWRMTEASIKSIREKGGIPYFLPPASSRVLYPRDEIIMVEQERLNLTSKGKCKQNKSTVNKRKKPVNSADLNKEWRI
jgi:hypothetical protein